MCGENMTCFKLYCLTAVFFATNAVANPLCGPNEIVNKNFLTNVNDCCPTACGQTSVCSLSTNKPCVCNVMFLRAQNNTCIRSRDCPPIPCPDNEEYDPCPVCSESCDNAFPTGQRCRFIGRIGVTVICAPKCRCIDMYWRNNSGKCVPYAQCCPQ